MCDSRSFGRCAALTPSSLVWVVIWYRLHHPQENIRKSTSIHATVLCVPGTIRICHLPTHTEKAQQMKTAELCALQKNKPTLAAAIACANNKSKHSTPATATTATTTTTASSTGSGGGPISTAKQNRQPKIRKKLTSDAGGATDGKADASGVSLPVATAAPAAAPAPAPPPSASASGLGGFEPAVVVTNGVSVMYDVPTYDILSGSGSGGGGDSYVSDTVLLYPSKSSVYLDDPSIDIKSIKRVIVVESTWQKGAVVCAHPNLARVRHIKLKERISTFWRYQELGNRYLSTLEAMHAVCVDWTNAKAAAQKRADTKQSADTKSGGGANGYAGEYDDLMFIYAYMHSRIKKLAETTGMSGPTSDAESATDSGSAAGGGSGGAAAAVGGDKKRYPKIWRPADSVANTKTADIKS